MELKYPLEAILKKEGQMIYFSQLDLVKILSRALRRSGLNIYYTKGFSPHPKISFFSGLKLGEEGEIRVVFYFKEKITLSQLKSHLNKQLPSGLRII